MLTRDNLTLIDFGIARSFDEAAEQDTHHRHAGLCAARAVRLRAERRAHRRLRAGNAAVLLPDAQDAGRQGAPCGLPRRGRPRAAGGGGARGGVRPAGPLRERAGARAGVRQAVPPAPFRRQRSGGERGGGGGERGGDAFGTIGSGRGRGEGRGVGDGEDRIRGPCGGTAAGGRAQGPGAAPLRLRGFSRPACPGSPLPARSGARGGGVLGARAALGGIADAAPALLSVLFLCVATDLAFSPEPGMSATAAPCPRRASRLTTVSPSAMFLPGFFLASDRRPRLALSLRRAAFRSRCRSPPALPCSRSALSSLPWPRVRRAPRAPAGREPRRRPRHGSLTARGCAGAGAPGTLEWDGRPADGAGGRAVRAPFPTCRKEPAHGDAPSAPSSAPSKGGSGGPKLARVLGVPDMIVYRLLSCSGSHRADRHLRRRVHRSRPACRAARLSSSARWPWCSRRCPTACSSASGRWPARCTPTPRAASARASGSVVGVDAAASGLSRSSPCSCTWWPPTALSGHRAGGAAVGLRRRVRGWRTRS